MYASLTQETWQHDSGSDVMLDSDINKSTSFIAQVTFHEGPVDKESLLVMPEL